MASLSNERCSLTPPPKLTNTSFLKILNYLPSIHVTSNATRARTGTLELCDGNRDSLLVRVADADVDALHTNALGLFLSVPRKLAKC
jgi:hypothetical protein